MMITLKSQGLSGSEFFFSQTSFCDFLSQVCSPWQAPIHDSLVIYKIYCQHLVLVFLSKCLVGGVVRCSCITSTPAFLFFSANMCLTSADCEKLQQCGGEFQYSPLCMDGVCGCGFAQTGKSPRVILWTEPSMQSEDVAATPTME